MDYACYRQRVVEQPKLMEQMAERVGLDRAAAEAADGGLAWFAACTKCVFCPEPTVCADWLDGKNTSARPADFCPNTSFFAKYIRED